MSKTIDRPELFRIHDDCINAASSDEVKATVISMIELGIYHSPYKDFDIEISYMFFTKSLNILVKNKEPPIENPSNIGVVRIKFKDEKFDKLLFSHDSIRYDSLQDLYHIHKGDGNFTLDNLIRAAQYLALYQKDLLITLLATKNVVKTKTENKALRLGIGAKNSFKPIYTTTLSLPPRDTLEHVGSTGISPRPHLRRGHVRQQHYGPRNSFIKKIWIQPTFVNADEDFISSREGYNASIPPPTLESIKNEKHPS